MKHHHHHHHHLLRLLLFNLTLHHHLLRLTQAQPSTTGYNCTTTTYPCKTYVYYYATSPDYLDLASIGDLFSLSRRSIAITSNISSPSSPLAPNQPLLIPITCACSPTTTTSSALLPYTILSGDTFYYVSTYNYQNLTTYQAVELANPSLVPTNLTIGTVVNFPIFCKCPQNNTNTTFLITYVLQPSDTLASVATKFQINVTELTAINPKHDAFDTIFVPVSKLPVLPSVSITKIESNSTSDSRKRVVIGLGIGLGFCGFLLILVIGLLVYRENFWRKMRGFREVENGVKRKMKMEEEVNLMADVSGCLDKYRIFGIGELREATSGFDEGFVIQGSVYKGVVGGEVYAIKKMKWDAYEELKILQKVNHGNLVKLEGFCIDPEDANCYLVYEYVENGSLYSWLHEKTNQKLGWKTRLRIAIDIANGLQYIHEHTRPQVVHKDIKSSNILLDSNMRAKIANFGLAKSGCNAITMHIVGTQGYISPEYLADGVVSTKMDVFSFGVVLLELVSGKEAVDKEGRVLWASAARVLDGGEEEKASKLRRWMDGGILEDSCSVESLMNVMVVAVACTHKDPSKRPTMVDIVYALCKSDDLFFDISDDTISTSMVLAR